jgi:hypothetical protein
MLCSIPYGVSNTITACKRCINPDKEVHTIVLVYFIHTVAFVKTFAKDQSESLLLYLDNYFKIKFENNNTKEIVSNPFCQFNKHYSNQSCQNFTRHIANKNPSKKILEIYLPYDIIDL